MSRVSKTAGCAIAFVFAVGVAHASEVTPPADIAKAGKITYCAEFGNPPLGFYDENQVLG
ncbi:MAG: ABC transporter substrate-binding protein, partial [Mesorhizobium sp.]